MINFSPKIAKINEVNKLSFQYPESIFKLHKPIIRIGGPAAVETTYTYHHNNDFIVFEYTYLFPIEGTYIVDLSIEGVVIEENPFTIIVEKERNLSPVCELSGDGIKRAFLGEVNEFTVNTKDVGTGYLVVNIESINGDPADLISIFYMGNGIYKVEYKISFLQNFNLNVMFNGVHIYGSPFSITPIRIMETRL